LGIDGERRTDIPCPPYSRAAEEIAVVLRDLEQVFRRIGPAVDPMRTSGEREVTVGVDHPRDNRRATRVDDADVGRQGRFVGGRAQPRDVAIRDKNAHTFSKGRTRHVGEGRVPVEGRSRRCHRSPGCIASFKRCTESGEIFRFLCDETR
jgi:hypothetical protein